MIHIFQPFVWFSTFVLGAFVWLGMWIVSNVAKNEVTNYTEAQSILLIVFGTLLSCIPKSVPKTGRIRWIFVMWSFFCLNWISAYTSSLVSMITTPLHANQVLCSTLILSKYFIFPSLSYSRLKPLRISEEMD